MDRTLSHNKKYLIEQDLVLRLKSILDPENNFARPLSEFWKDSSLENTLAFGHYGIWLSAEGGTLMKRDNEYVADYYDIQLSQGHPDIQRFMEENNLKLRWHDPGTPILIFKDDEI